VRPGVYKLRVFDGTKQVSRNVRAEGKTEANKLLAQFVAEVLDRGEGVSPTRTVAVLLDEFISHSRSRGRSPKTVYEAQRAIDRILKPALGAVKLHTLTTRQVDNLYRRLVEDGKSPGSIRRYHAVLSAALNQGVRWQWIGSNPAALATLPAESRPEIEAITIEDAGRLITAAEATNPRFAMLLKLGILTGARRGELCALRWRDVDLVNGLIRIWAALYRAGDERGEKTTKSGRITEVPLDDYGVALVSSWKAAQSPMSDDCFIVSSTPDGLDPVNPDSFSSFMYRIANRAGIKLAGRNPLRHLAGTELLAAGMDPRSVADYLGHADPSITLRRYAHARLERRRSGAVLLSSVLRRATEPTPTETPSI
jgi:integrase